MYVRRSDHVVEHHIIPGGHWGIEKTVDHMRRMGREGLGHYQVQRHADALASPARTQREAAERIRSFLARSVRFHPDPYGVELIRTPRYILDKIEDDGQAIGDCDDVAVLGASLGMASGLGARYVLVGLTPREPYEHVYTELLTDAGEVVELDTTRPAQMPADIVIHRLGYREA